MNAAIERSERGALARFDLDAPATTQPGARSRRLRGAGYGGCTVTRVPRAGTERFEREVGAADQQARGLRVNFYTALPDEGAQQESP